MPRPDPEKRREYDRLRVLLTDRKSVSAESKERTRHRAIDMLGGACSYCGITDKIVLVLDHKANDGAQDRKTHYAGSLPSRIVRGKVDLASVQVLCHNCNWRKEYLRRKNAK